ncbi:MAG: NADH-quinone oxidoreductase subunit, partial [Solirubrobacterales bacterium]|nr:NADH-quinone oxidoreductase subunit [Solirubrobacterales bacterium]
MLRGYLPAIVFLALGGAVGGLFSVLNSLVGVKSKRIQSKNDPYECGIPSEIQSRFRFGISFYLIAMLFILF